MSTKYSQDSSYGRLWQQRVPTAVRPRPRLFLLGWATGFASHFFYERTWGARATSTASPQAETETRQVPRSTTPEQASTREPDASSANPAPTQKGAAAVWRGVFDPGSNPVVTRKGVEPGRSYYDTVSAESPSALTTWQQVLRSEEMRRYNFSDLIPYSAEALIKAADTDGHGRISYKDWLMIKAKLAEAYEKGDHESQAQAKVRAQKMRG